MAVAWRRRHVAATVILIGPRAKAQGAHNRRCIAVAKAHVAELHLCERRSDHRLPTLQCNQRYSHTRIPWCVSSARLLPVCCRQFCSSLAVCIAASSSDAPFCGHKLGNVCAVCGKGTAEGCGGGMAGEPGAPCRDQQQQSVMCRTQSAGFKTVVLIILVSLLRCLEEKSGPPADSTPAVSNSLLVTG